MSYADTLNLIYLVALATTTLKLTFSYHSRSCTSYSFLASIEIDSSSSYAIISLFFQGLNSVSGCFIEPTSMDLLGQPYPTKYTVVPVTEPVPVV